MKQNTPLIGMVASCLMAMTLTTQAAPKKIMFLGDSLTNGSAGKPVHPDKVTSEYKGQILVEDQISYRGELWKMLKDENVTIDNKKVTIAGTQSRKTNKPLFTPDGYTYDEDATIDFVGTRSKNKSTFHDTHKDFDENHEGYHGMTSKEFLSGRKITASGENFTANIDNILKENTPDIVLMHIGTNDAAKGISIAESKANIKKIIDKIIDKNSNVKILLAKIIEARRSHNFPGGLNGKAWHTTDFNNEIAKLANANDNVTIVDMQKGASIQYTPAGLKGDMQPNHKVGNYPDYHPNENGYKKMAAKWFEALKKPLNIKVIHPTGKIFINGYNPMYITQGDTYKEEGATLGDKNATVSGAVDTNKVGEYTLTYTSGTKTETRKVIVQPKEVLKGWLIYDALKQQATITKDKTTSVLTVEPKEDMTRVDAADSITLKHKNAYITAKSDATVITGFKSGSADDSTLEKGTAYPASTRAAIKNSGAIETTTTLNINESLTIGGK
ncbi:MAG: GDSL-type esterase/lipase family protein [Sulfurovum sp.]|nr:GDSL-type esterase/lipase family protein [Sulfurovum sp.]